MEDPEILKEWIRTAGEGVDVLKEILPYLSRPWRQTGGDNNQANAGLAKSIFGSQEELPTFNFEVNRLLGIQSRPFVLRVGERISLPGDDARRNIRMAIQQTQIWDWSYVFNARHLRHTDRVHLRAAYFEQGGSPRQDIATSTLKITDSTLPDDFEKGILIFGLETGGEIMPSCTLCRHEILYR